MGVLLTEWEDTVEVFRRAGKGGGLHHESSHRELLAEDLGVLGGLMVTDMIKVVWH